MPNALSSLYMPVRCSMLAGIVSFLFCLFIFPPAAWAADSAPLPVVVTIAPQKYMLERIAGDAIHVDVLISPGADPHSYEPGPSLMRSAANAKAWFTIGMPFEDVWLERIRKLSPGLAVVSSIKGIKRVPFHFIDSMEQAAEKHDKGPQDHSHTHNEPDGHDHGLAHGGGSHEQGHSHDGLDPHVWLSPMLVREMLPNMARELGRLIPARAPEFRARAREFAAELERLDEDIARRFSSVPENKRVFLTFHPSWQYFARNYQLRELSIEVDGKEPGPRSMQAVIDKAKQYGITTVFIEPQFSKSAARAIAQSIGANVAETDPLAEDLLFIYRDMTEKLLSSFPR